MEETWFQIKDFPNYAVSSYGRICNEERGRIVKTSTTRQGGIKVGLTQGGRQYTRSVKVLVAEAFIKGRTHTFDTPMHLDGDQSNNHISNIVWRPRWFAWKYARQFEKIDDYIGLGPISDRKTGLLYSDIVEASLANGVLFYEVHLSLVNKMPVFPTWHIFDWVKETDNQ